MRDITAFQVARNRCRFSCQRAAPQYLILNGSVGAFGGRASNKIQSYQASARARRALAWRTYDTAAGSAHGGDSRRAH
jgi:hypothetical protein